MPDLNLTDAFPDYDQDAWQALAEKGLRDADFSSLVKKTDDNIPRGPLATAADLPNSIAALPRAGAPLLDGRPWHITTQMRDTNIAFANQQALEDLTGGASALRLSLCARGVGVKTKNDLKRLFDQIITDLVPILIGPQPDMSKLDLLAGLPEMQSAHICLGLAPKTKDLKARAQDLPETWRAVTINAARVHETGGTEVQELAYLAASAAYTFRVLGPELAAKHIGAELTTNQDAHLSIAKLRAARRIYARIAESFGASETTLPLHAMIRGRICCA